MATEALKTMKEQLMNCVQGQLGDLAKVNTHELGEAIDMIKDLAEAIYYCTITDSMEKSDEKKEQTINYYTAPSGDMYYDPWRHGERSKGYMYYPTGNWETSSASQSYMNEMHRDPRQGRSYMRRRTYMEGKERHNDPTSQLKELQAYLQELSTDITEMIKDSSPEERATLRQKMTNLANKIS